MTQMDYERLLHLFEDGETSLYPDLIRTLTRLNRTEEIDRLHDYIKTKLLPPENEFVRLYITKKFKKFKETLLFLEIVTELSGSYFLEYMLSVSDLFQRYTMSQISLIIYRVFESDNYIDPNHINHIGYTSQGEAQIGRYDTSSLHCDFRVDKERHFHQFKIYHTVYSSDNRESLRVPLNENRYGIPAFYLSLSTDPSYIVNYLLQYLTIEKLTESLKGFESYLNKAKESLIRYGREKDPYRLAQIRVNQELSTREIIKRREQKKMRKLLLKESQ